MMTRCVGLLLRQSAPEKVNAAGLAGADANPAPGFLDKVGSSADGLGYWC